MLTREELKRTITRIFDRLRDNKEYEGSCTCDGIKLCSKCPFDGDHIFCLSNNSIDNIFNAFEYVEKWAKEHPLVTMKDKFNEVFGVEPVHTESEIKCYLCPKFAGLGADIKCTVQTCENCKEDFWDSEYKPPKKEG